MEYCVELEDARRRRSDATEDEKKDWRDTITRIEADLKKGKIADPNKTSFGQGYPGASLLILWTYKAWLLPENPSFEDGGASGHSGDLELWLDAAMARARIFCWNDWENYKWPKCVEARRKQNKKRFRSAEDVVREKLREGMKQLVSVPPATL
jgi:hypothetical protein